MDIKNEDTETPPAPPNTPITPKKVLHLHWLFKVKHCALKRVYSEPVVGSEGLSPNSCKIAPQ
jgi:hypothetical protein